MCSNTVSCPLCCHNSFPNIDSLRISLIKVANGPLSCPICKEILLGLDKLTIHLFGHTSILTVNPYISSEHIDTTSDQPLIQDKSPKLFSSELPQGKCDICGLSFRSVELLNMHNKLVHRISGGSSLINSNDTKVPYQCHLCAKSFKMKGSLRVHLKVVHLLGLPTNNTIKLNLCEIMKNQNSNIEPITTNQLTQVKTEIVSNGIHLISLPEENPKHEKESSILNDLPKSPTESKGSSGESGKIWECDICSKSFTTKYFLKKHKRLHTGEMPYTCEICGKTFTFQQSYHKHLLYHSDEKPHICQTCGRAFKELSTLHNHERIHSGEKPFKCESCGKCFRQRVSYLVHKRIHTGVMPYTCTICQKNFRYKVSQRTHKCIAPPSTISVRENGDLLQKLLNTNEITEVEDSKTVLNEELLNKSIDEIVAESCNKMGIGTLNDIDDKMDDEHDRISSPSEKFQNLCLYSPSTDSFVTHLENINDDSIKHLLYGVDENL